MGATQCLSPSHNIIHRSCIHLSVFTVYVVVVCAANQTRKFGSHHETPSGYGASAEAAHMLTPNGNDEYFMLKDATTTVNDISK